MYFQMVQFSEKTYFVPKQIFDQECHIDPSISKEWKMNFNCLPYNFGLNFVYFHPVAGVILRKTAT